MKRLVSQSWSQKAALLLCITRAVNETAGLFQCSMILGGLCIRSLTEMCERVKEQNFFLLVMVPRTTCSKPGVHVRQQSLSSQLSLNREGRWGTIDDFITSFLHFPLFSTALWDLANSRPVHFLMLSSHLFLYLPCLFPPFTVPRKMVLARPDERET